MSLEFRERLNHERLWPWIPDLIVIARARGQGAGRALVAQGIELARAQGCRSVTLESGYQRKAAHALYRANGMRDEGLYFCLHL